MKLKNTSINDILVITLSNLGDVILSFPVIDILKRDFPAARLSIVVGPKAESLFAGNPYIHKVYVFDKRLNGLQKLAWIKQLRKETFDLAVDLRNSAIPFVIRARLKTSPSFARSADRHMRVKHLNRLKSIFDFHSESQDRYALFVPEVDQNYIDRLLQEKIGKNQKIVVVSPGAANHIKRWGMDGFAAVCDHLVKLYSAKILFVGDKHDAETVLKIQGLMCSPAINLCGQITLIQLADLLRRSTLALANDSAVMHMASYLNVPVVAIFGPTDPKKYGPWGSRNIVVKKDIFCAPCERSSCAYNHECMKFVTPSDVLDAVAKIIH